MLRWLAFYLSACLMALAFPAQGGETPSFVEGAPYMVESDRYPHGAPEDVKDRFRRALEIRKQVRESRFPNYPHDVPERLREVHARADRKAEEHAQQRFEKDGKTDTWEIYSAAGELLIRMTDNWPPHAPDGQVDVTEYFRNGKSCLRLSASNMGAFFVPGVKYEVLVNGEVAVVPDAPGAIVFYPWKDRNSWIDHGDINKDGIPDQWDIAQGDFWWSERDRNHDGRVDSIRIRPKGLRRDDEEYLDEDYDGVFDRVVRRRYKEGVANPEETSEGLGDGSERKAPKPLFGAGVYAALLKYCREQEVKSPKPSPETPAPPATPPPAPVSSGPSAAVSVGPGWSLTVGIGLAGLLLGFALAAFIFRRRRA